MGGVTGGGHAEAPDGGLPQHGRRSNHSKLTAPHSTLLVKQVAPPPPQAWLRQALRAPQVGRTSSRQVRSPGSIKGAGEFTALLPPDGWPVLLGGSRQ